MIIPAKYYHHFEEFVKPNIDNVILSCYFTSKRDPIHAAECENKHQKKDNYEYIKPLYDSVKKLNLHLVIFHDGLSSDFLKKYQINNIFFVKTKLLGGLSINDERYIIYYQFLLKYKYKNVLTSDISDVYVAKNPFNLIDNFDLNQYKDLEEIVNSDLDERTKWKKIAKIYNLRYSQYEIKYFINSVKKLNMNISNKLFIGMNTMIRDTFTRDWFIRRAWKIDPFNQVLKDNNYDDKGFLDESQQIYNCGLVMAEYNKMIYFLEKFIEILLMMAKKREHNNWNMVIANYVINKFYCNHYDTDNFTTDLAHSGFPFNSMYKKNENIDKTPSCLIHK